MKTHKCHGTPPLSDNHQTRQKSEHLDLSDNQIGPAGTERLAGVLGQCTTLVHLNLSCNVIGSDGTESLPGVLGQCTALTQVDLQYNDIETVGEGRLRAS